MFNRNRNRLSLLLPFDFFSCEEYTFEYHRIASCFIENQSRKAHRILFSFIVRVAIEIVSFCVVKELLGGITMEFEFNF